MKPKAIFLKLVSLTKTSPFNSDEIKIIIVWKIGILLITFLGLSLLPTMDFYSKIYFSPDINPEYWIRWANWDGKGYLDIAKQGYTPGMTVLFPIYPLSIKLLSLFGINYFIAGIMIAHLSFLGGCFFFIKLAQMDYPKLSAKKALISLLIYPTSFYFGAVYSESLTFLLILTSFYFARKKYWLLASVLAGLSASTRLIGIAAIAGVFIEYFFNNHHRLNLQPVLKNLLGSIVCYLIIVLISVEISIDLLLNQSYPILLGVLITVREIVFYILGGLIVILTLKSLPSLTQKLQLTTKKLLSSTILLTSLIPFSLYLFYQYFAFGSPFMFVQQQVNWGRVLTYPWVGPLNSLIYLTKGFFYIGEYSAHIHFRTIIFIISCIFLFFSFQKQRLSYSIFFSIALFLPLFTGTLADISRYTLLIFPMFFLFGTIKNEFLQKTGSFLSILSLALLSIMFINSYFFI